MKHIRLIKSVILFNVILIQGCANYQVRIPSSDPLEKNYQSTTMHGLAWGAWMSPELLAVCQQEQAINDVVIKRNLLYDFTSVVTLGLWMPLDINYRCRAPDINGSGFPE